MKLSIRKNALNEAINHVSKAISSRTTIPILNGIKMDAAANGVTLTASDTDISIQSFIPATEDNKDIVKLEQAGSVVLPKFFIEIVKKLPSDDVQLEVLDNHKTMIRSGSAEIELVGLDPEEYPLLPKLEEDRVFTINGLLLRSMIKQTVFAVSTNESTPVLTGVLWYLSDGKLKFVATDRHRLASAECQIDGNTDLKLEHLVVAGKTLNELSKIIPDDGTLIDIVATDNQILFKLNNILFYSRILDGTYPDTSKIISQTYKTEMTISTKALTDAIDRAYLLSREEKTNIVRLVTIGSSHIEISSSSSELGKVTEQIETHSLQGDELKISFNSKYMLDALKVIDSDNIHIGFTGMMSPIIIRPEEDQRMLHLILPYRTTT